MTEKKIRSVDVDLVYAVQTIYYPSEAEYHISRSDVIIDGKWKNFRGDHYLVDSSSKSLPELANMIVSGYESFLSRLPELVPDCEDPGIALRVVPDTLLERQIQFEGDSHLSLFQPLSHRELFSLYESMHEALKDRF